MQIELVTVDPRKPEAPPQVKVIANDPHECYMLGMFANDLDRAGCSVTYGGLNDVEISFPLSVERIEIVNKTD